MRFRSRVRLGGPYNNLMFERALQFVPVYVLVVFLAQYTSWGGARSIFEQHAFLLPAPFFDM